MDNGLLVIAGPTAVGKTSLSVKAAKAFGGEIISADSMQVYKKMDIGTAKITADEMDGIKHYLIDIVEPDEPFNVYRFKELALKAIAEVRSNGHLPIIVGGTGFYIQSVLYDIDLTKASGDTTYRQELSELARTNGNGYLHDMLRDIDPDAAAAIHPNNVRKVIRALEFCHETGTLISRHNETERSRPSPYNFLYIVLYRDRAVLYSRIDARVDSMIASGLEDEVRALLDMGCTRDMVSMQGLGYKEMASYIYGECTLEEAASRIKQSTRHFAKRQLTWSRREKETVWMNMDVSPEQELIDDIRTMLIERGIIDNDI